MDYNMTEGYFIIETEHIEVHSSNYSNNGCYGNHTCYYDDNYAYQSATNSASESFSYYMNVFGQPFLIIFGILSNALSLTVFIHTRRRSQSCSIYLAYLNIVDSGFLLSLIPAWLAWLGVDLVHKNVWCQLTVYTSYVFSFLSVWTVVAFTVERFIVVYHPFKRAIMCTKKRAVRVLIGLTSVALVFYSYSVLLLRSRVTPDGLQYCVPLDSYANTYFILASLVELLLTFIIPSLSIIILNGSIFWKIAVIFKNGFTLEPKRGSENSASLQSAHEPFKTASQSSSSNSGDIMCGASVATTTLPRHSRIADRMQLSVSRRKQNQLKTTRALLIISTVFLLLNLPSHIFRLIVFLRTMQSSPQQFSKPVLITSEICSFIYYFNFSANMLLYVAVSHSFRSGLKSLMTEFRKQCASALQQCVLRVNYRMDYTEHDVDEDVEELRHDIARHAKHKCVTRPRSGHIKGATVI